MGSRECLVISETPQICNVNSMLVLLSLTAALLIFIQSFWQGLGSIYLNLDPDPGLWWALAVINVRTDNFSQTQFLPLPTNSERNQTSPQNWFKAKTLLSGEGLFILSSFLTLTLFEFWTTIYAKGLTFRISKRPKMQVTSRLQMSNGLQRVYCDLRNPSDLHCQLNVGHIIQD